MPITVSNWNFTNRFDSTTYDDYFRGKQNAAYTLRTEKPNQGYASSKCVFPHGSFHSCRYSNNSTLKRTPETNNWHPFVHTPSGPFEWISSAKKNVPIYQNTTNSRELPPHCYNINLPPPLLPKVELPKKSKPMPPSLKPPSHSDIHTTYSHINETTKIKDTAIFRPSKKSFITNDRPKTE